MLDIPLSHVYANTLLFNVRPARCTRGAARTPTCCLLECQRC